MSRAPFAFFLLMAIAVVAIAQLARDGEDRERRAGASEGRGAASAARTPIPVIAGRIERLRELRFERPPATRRLRAGLARREGLAELDREYPASQRLADEETLKLLGLLAPRDDVRGIFGSVFGEQVAGFYDIRRKRLTLVEGSSGGPAFQEITLAHELVHALEDQRFGLEDPTGGGVEDGESAYAALTEGTATAVMNEYAIRYSDPGSTLGELLSSGLRRTTPLPPYVEASLTFPYFAGAGFVNALFQAGGWRLVNTALDERPPASTEQVMHPERYLRVDPPERLTLRPDRQLSASWRRVARGDIGEFDTAELLRLGDRGQADDAAEGWGGGRYELWRTGPLPDPGCPAPCRRRDALVLAWSWDTPGEARQFNRALIAYVERGLKARRAGTDRWRLAGGAIAGYGTRQTTTLAFAPTTAEATRLARRSLADVSG